jgi:hypothetical protein
VGRQRAQTAALGCASTPALDATFTLDSSRINERRDQRGNTHVLRLIRCNTAISTIKGVLQKIIITISKSGCDLKPFDCVTACTVRSAPLGLGIIVMMEAVTAFFGVISAGIFLAHAVDGYRSR